MPNSPSQELFDLMTNPPASAEVIRKLLAQGADPNFIPQGSSEPAFLRLVGRVTIEALGLLLDGGAKLDLTDGPTDYRTAVHQLLLLLPSDLDAQLLLLLDRGAAVDQPDGSGTTPLMLATRHATVSTMKILLSRGADPNAKSKLKYRVLADAKRESNKWRLLLDAGANPDLETEPGRTAIFSPVLFGWKDIVTLLLEHKVDLNIVDKKNGQTALFLAVQEGHLELARLLVEKGTDLRIKDKKHRTALEFAREIQNREMVLLLGQSTDVSDFDKKVKADSPALESRKKRILDSILEKGLIYRRIEPGFKYEYEIYREIFCDGTRWVERSHDTYTGEISEVILGAAEKAMARMINYEKASGDSPDKTLTKVEKCIVPKS